MTEKTSVLLVVDDRPDNLFVIEQVVNEYITNCIVHTADNVDIALGIALELQPDGILSDIQMPGKNGIDLCRLLKQSPKISHIPVLLITSHESNQNLRVQGLEAGADDFIARPINNLELAARIKVMFRIKHIQDELIEAKRNLEKTVAERTENLKKANDQLILEIEERKQAEAEREKLQAQLTQSQKMESIGTLAGGIAHDFNNILFPIVGYSEMLIEDAPEDSHLRDSLNKIYAGTIRASELVKQILTFSRQGTNELKLIKMQSIIKEALKLIRSSIPTTIEIKQDINPKCGAIKADPTQIHQIVMNLATNAYHAMEENGGELKVNLKEIVIDEEDVITPGVIPGAYACLTIADTGIGMKKELIDKIFEPFFTTKGQGKGTGMGLSTVYGIVVRMGGAINVKSEPGKGTEFNLYFLLEKSSFKEQDIQTKKLQGGTERILIVDDENLIIEMEKMTLERIGYQITSYTSSIEAFEVFKNSPDKFDLVITDMAMPDMPGDKLAVRLIKIRSDIPVLLCTGFSEAMTEAKAEYLGIKGFLLKPILKTDLAKKIRELLDKK